jgi:hypothetical protein
MHFCIALAVVYTSGLFHFIHFHVFVLLRSLSSLQGLVQLLKSVENDPDLLQYMDCCVDKCSHDVECRVSDKHILQRQLTGPCIPSVAHIRPAKPGKRKNEDAGEGAAVKKFHGQPQSHISSIKAKPYVAPPKGTGKHLPQSAKRYCEYCNKWISKISFDQHKQSGIHNQNFASLESSGSKCKCDNSLVIVLSALNFCCRHVVPNL